MKFLLLLLLVGTPRLAAAHHVISDYGIAPVEPRSFAGLSVELARFERAFDQGTFQLVTPSAELAWGGRFSASAELPLARVEWSGGTTACGLGDLELGVKMSLFASHHGGFLLTWGLGVELPTGDAVQGLGAGHVELAPFLAVATTLSLLSGHELVIFGLLSDRAGLTHHEHQGEGLSVVAPHADNELFARAAAAYVVSSIYLSVGLDAVHILDGHGEGPWVARAELGLLFGRRLRVAVGGDTTVRGDPRFEHRGRLGMGWAF